MAKSRKIEEAFNTDGSKQLIDVYTNKIKIIDLGSASCNIVNQLYNSGINGVDFIVCSSDEQFIDSSRIPNIIRAKNLVAVDMQPPFDLVDFTVCDAIMNSDTEVLLILSETGETIQSAIAAGIARVAKKRGVITVGIVIIPLFPEAKESNLDIDKFCTQFNSSLVIDFNKSNTSKTILNVGPGLLPMNEAIANVIKGITAIVLEPQFEIKEIRSVLCDNNSIFAGFSVASGKKRAKKVIVSALTSPRLRKCKMANVKNVLLLLTSGTNALTIDEIGEISDYLQAAAGYNATITMAVSEDMKLGKSLALAIIAL